MGDAACELSDSLHATRLSQLTLQGSFVAHVVLDRHVAHDIAGRIVDWADYRLHLVHDPILADVEKRPVPVLRAGQARPHHCVDPATFHAAVQEAWLSPDEFGLRITRKPFEGRVDIEDAGLWISDDDRLCGLFDRSGQAQPLLVRGNTRGLGGPDRPGATGQDHI